MSGYAVINVTGAASLAGTLNIMLQNGYDPANGTMIKFLNLTPGGLSGTFGSVLNDTFNGGLQMWALDYNNGLGFVELTAEAVLSGTDYWLGGTGNWSNGGQWSLTNPPPPTQDAVIYFDIAKDFVTLDLGSTSVNSLTLGGSDLTYSSELTDGGTTQTLAITNGLTIGASGILSLTGGSTITASADSSNAGMVDLENGSTLGITGNFTNTGSFTTGSSTGGNTFTVSGELSNSGSLKLQGAGDSASVGTISNTGSISIGSGATLNLTNQPGGVTDVPAGASWTIYGSFTEGGTNFGFGHLATIEGSVELANGQTLGIDPTLTVTGSLDVSGGTSLTIAADVIQLRVPDHRRSRHGQQHPEHHRQADQQRDFRPQRRRRYGDHRRRPGQQHFCDNRFGKWQHSERKRQL